MIYAIVASGICMLGMGILGGLAGWAIGDYLGYAKGFQDGRQPGVSNDWETNRPFWGGYGDTGAVE